MSILRGIRYWNNQLRGIQLPALIWVLGIGMALSALVSSCETDSHPTAYWAEENSVTISQYLTNHQDEYSKSYRLLDEAKLLTTLYAYNPFGNDYTLFLPTDDAIDQFIEQNEQYGDFEELLKDTTFIKMIMRYHTINGSYHTDRFPDGAFIDTTLTGQRLVSSFFAKGNNQLIKINNVTPVVKPNLKMTNGYIHLISKVLQPVVISGYTWLQQQDKYTILAKAMDLSGVRKKLNWSTYTVLAEPDSIYRLYGINNVEDLISHIATPGLELTDTENQFYQFAAYHIMRGEYFMNDLEWGSKDYQTLSGQLLTIIVGQNIEINTGIDTYVLSTSGSGETTYINYIRPIADRYNILTRTGAVHSITDLLYNTKLPLGLKKEVLKD